MIEVEGGEVGQIMRNIRQVGDKIVRKIEVTKVGQLVQAQRNGLE